MCRVEPVALTVDFEGRTESDHIENENGIGVNPTSTNSKLAQPKIVRPVPSDTSSLAVGGCLGPMSISRSIISVQPQNPQTTTAIVAASSSPRATKWARRNSSA